MKPDPIIDPPAIVSPAQDLGDLIAADRINTLMTEALAIGRRTAEQAVECGKKLIEVQEECLRQNNGKRGLFLKTLKEFKVDRNTANRLIRKAKNAECIKLIHSLDAIYDDGGETPDESKHEGKVACRDCRHHGKKFDPKCRKCKAKNRPVPEPKEEKPLVDEDGTPVPEHLQPVWLDAQTIRSFNKQLLDFGKAIYGLTERPGCQGVPADHFSTKLKALCTSLWAFRPGFVCADCQGAGCETCDSRGWKSVAVVRGERAAAKAKEWAAKKANRSNAPIPE